MLKRSRWLETGANLESLLASFSSPLLHPYPAPALPKRNFASRKTRGHIVNNGLLRIIKTDE